MINWQNPTDKLSKYFTVREGIYLPKWDRLATEPDELTETVKDNLLVLFAKLDVVRDFFNASILVHVTLRPQEYNKLIGGAKNSAHITGQACDFHVHDLDCDTARKMILDAGALEKIGLRMEDLPGATWVHLDHAEPHPNRFFKP